MALGLLILRIAVGGLFAGHGAQKLFGSFGGHGIDGTAGFMESLGLRPGRRHAIAAGLSELAGGALLALGLLTPLAAVLLIGTMATAIATVHFKNGLWVTQSGYEYNLVLIAVAFALTAVGAGPWSLDHALSLHVSGTLWGIGALVVGVVGGLANLTVARASARHEPHPTHA